LLTIVLTQPAAWQPPAPSVLLMISMQAFQEEL
jgi:hypothetical protein